MQTEGTTSDLLEEDVFAALPRAGRRAAFGSSVDFSGEHDTRRQPVQVVKAPGGARRRGARMGPGFVCCR